MTRSYDSTRRKASARQTRAAIVEAAVKMHGQGVTTLAPVADEAGVALPTLYKHFPRREDLFAACTSHMATTLEYPDPGALGAVADSAVRLQRIVDAACTLNEKTLGQAWTGYLLAAESDAMASAMQDYEHFVRELAAAIPGPSAEARIDERLPIASALLGPLTYRAARVRGGMSPPEISSLLTDALGGVFGIDISSLRDTPE